MLFSILKEKLARDNLSVTLNKHSTGKQLLDYLVDKYPPILPYRKVIRLAVNESYVSESYELKQGDVVALITPVSGG